MEVINGSRPPADNSDEHELNLSVV